MKITLSIITILITAFFISCSQNPITGGTFKDEIKVEWAGVGGITETSAIVTWKCSFEAVGFLHTSGSNFSRLDTTILKSEIHALPVSGLINNQNYQAIPSCGASEQGLSFPIGFKTASSLKTIYERSIWIVGGTGVDNNPIGPIDYYDPITNTWSQAVTSIPTPRVNAQIVSHNGKIFIIGGMTKSGGTYSVSRIVETYDPIAGTWQQYDDIPNTVQGGIVGSIGEEIFVIGGTTSLDMTTGTVLNTVYQFRPDVTNGGNWSNYTSSTSIFGRIDMSACTYSGSIIYSGGRFYQDGLAYATTDAYTPSLNSTTGKIEASISLARHGAAASCYRPKQTDRYNTDPPIYFIAGGSTGTNISQPVTSITPSNRFEFMGLTGSSNLFTTGSNLPENLYAPAMEIDYENRILYLFGGATSINLPTNKVRTLNLDNPGSNSWVELPSLMPRARFGHQAIILNR
ncbi:galactose oxidase [Leptospira kanakyensis]|uniref:Galactose oxidase n=1 Tax=Leptospira kanakyensis TaxID=2484968 RepID=A0A6N4QJF3_9LEPT|nr:galactose oxidase [Leptospira kanakyensis]TGK53863.1 galactose oxidase [Leptospira kanakyensis]TGK57658.1 galactose oxidase [Leptospira kanakyensis]TGK73368.1 galactose oxidase [Leptospira kanakyensis]